MNNFREDYLVEAMEVVEMYCDLLLARFGLVTQMKELDDGIAEAVSSVVWVCPRLQSDISELKVISDIFIQKYGPQFAEKARTATGDRSSCFGKVNAQTATTGSAQIIGRKIFN